MGDEKEFHCNSENPSGDPYPDFDIWIEIVNGTVTYWAEGRGPNNQGSAQVTAEQFRDLVQLHRNAEIGVLRDTITMALTDDNMNANILERIAKALEER